MDKIPRVFVSYKYSTPQFSRAVRDLAAELMHFRMEVVLDQQELGYGGDFRDFMEHNIATADVVLVVVTSEFNRALASTGPWGTGARFEVERAVARLSNDPAFRVIPVLLDEARPERSLSRLKAIDLSDPALFRHQIARLAGELLLAGHPGHAHGLLADRYRVDQLIEQRGMAHVFVGYDTRLSTEVELYGCGGASGTGDPRLLQLASRIARARSRAYSPFLLNYRDFLPYTDAYEVVTERFVGPDLEVCLSRGHRFPPAQVCAQGCLALVELHNVGLVHAGLVPRALRIGRNGNRGAVKIVDFEFAAPAGESELDPGAISGYPMAMPPEKWDGSPHTEKGDVYQLGTLLFRLLTGQKLLNRATLIGMPRMANSAHCLIEDLDAAKLGELIRRTGLDADSARYAEAIQAMAAPDPESRPTDQEALRMLFRLGADPTGYSESLDIAQQRTIT